MGAKSRPIRKYEIRDGELFLACRGCEKMLPEDSFHPDDTAGYFKRKSRCKTCKGHQVRYNKRRAETRNESPADMLNRLWKPTGVMK